MSLQDIAAAMERVESVMRRRPELGLHDDSRASARWDGGLRVSASHAVTSDATMTNAGPAASSHGHARPPRSGG